MDNALKYLLVLTFTIWQTSSSAQKLHYTPQEATLIHDSILQSRWDIGGALSQYSFRYMSEFFPVGIISKSEKPYPFPVKLKTSFDRIRIKSKKDTISLEEHLKSLHITSFIVMHKGMIVYEKYFSMLQSDQHTLQSVTKVITSTIITSLINEKKINPAFPVETYLPELKGSDWEGISVKDILNMRSGMDNKSIDFSTGPFTNPAHKNYQLESALGVLPKVPGTQSSVYKLLGAMKRDTLPGVQAAYSNLNTFVLGWLAEKVTARKFADLVTERIWQPIGANSDAYICQSDNGLAWTHGGMSSTLRDLARFGMLFTKSDIKSRNEKLISFQQLKEIFDTPPITNSFAPLKWGYQWDFASDGIMMKSGFGGQSLYVDPEQEIVIAHFNYVDKDWDMRLISDAALAGILKAATAKQ